LGRIRGRRQKGRRGMMRRREEERKRGDEKQAEGSEGGKGRGESI
jgi:hypothetical protein